MSKLNSILFLLLLVSLASFGQTRTKKVDVKWGNETKATKKTSLDGIVGYDESGFYVTKSKPVFGGYFTYLEHYDKKMNLTKSVQLKFKVDNKTAYFAFATQIKNTIYCFTTFIDKKAKENKMYLQTINKMTLEPNNDRREVAKINYEGHSRYNSGNFSLVTSLDSTKYLIYYNLPYEKGGKEKFGFKVFDDNMRKIWQRKITLPYSDKLFSVADYDIDNDGNAVIIGKLYKDKVRNERDGSPNYTYHVLYYTDEGQNLVEYPIKLEDKFITDLKVIVNDKKDIICAGFYSDEGSYSVKGTFYLRIDHKTKDIIAKGFKEFDMNFITQNLTEHQENKAKKKNKKGKNVEMFDYDLDNIILKDDGGATLVGEQFFIRIVTTTNSKGTTYTTYHYYYNDIIVINIAPDGNIEWATKIAKRQHSVNDGGKFSSYAMMVRDDGLYFIFNDNPKNLYYKGQGKVAYAKFGKESLAVLVEVTNEGKQTREAMFKKEEAEVLIQPKVCEQISEDQMVLFGTKRSIQKFALLTFKD